MLLISTEEFLRAAPKYLEAAENGETILISRDGNGGHSVAIRIEKADEKTAHDTMGGAVPVDDYSWAIVGGKRPVGLAQGQFTVPDDFDAPLPDEILDAFEGR